jgi:hypothetical protein
LATAAAVVRANGLLIDRPAAAPGFVYEKDGKQAVKLVFRNCMSKNSRCA